MCKRMPPSLLCKFYLFWLIIHENGVVCGIYKKGVVSANICPQKGHGSIGIYSRTVKSNSCYFFNDYFDPKVETLAFHMVVITSGIRTPSFNEASIILHMHE